MELYNEAVMQMMHHLAPEFQETQVIADFEVFSPPPRLYTQLLSLLDY